jgi:hypothetical protein
MDAYCHLGFAYPDSTKLVEMDSKGMHGWDKALAMCYSNSCYRMTCIALERRPDSRIAQTGYDA